MPDIALGEIWRYPVKSMRGLRSHALEVGRRGFVHDRSWMLVEPGGRFLTQRQLPRMALIDTRLEAGRLWLEAPGMQPLAVAEADPDSAELVVEVWRETCTAVAPDPAADAWLAEFLDRPVRLVFMPDGTRRPVDPMYGRTGDEVGFADGFPFLLISQASLDHLNAKLGQPIPMPRFRPNLVVTGTEAHAEDDWRRIRIGELTLRLVKPCSRCAIPTIDIETGRRGPEPIATLATYRRRDNWIYFGQNLVHDGPGWLREGDPVEVLE